MMRNNLLAVFSGARVLCTALIVVGLIGCVPRDAEPDRTLRVMLDWTPNVNHIGIYLADRLGYFAENGLEVEIIIPGEVFPVAALLAGEVEFGIDFQESLTLLSNQTDEIISVAAILQGNTSGFATLDQSVDTMADLQNRRYGTFYSPFEEPIINNLLVCDGISDPSFQAVPVGNSVLELLQEEQADFAWIYYGTQGVQAEINGIALSYVPMSDYFDCIPDYYTPVITTARLFAQQYPEVVTRFIEAVGKGYRFAYDNPTDAALMFVEDVPEYDTAEIKRSIEWLSPFLLDAEGRWGFQQPEIWYQFAQWMYDNDLLERAPDRAKVGSLFSNEYLP